MAFNLRLNVIIMFSPFCWQKYRIILAEICDNIYYGVLTEFGFIIGFIALSQNL